MAHEILIVDDEPDIRLLIDGILRDEGYETRQAADSDAAIAAFRMRRPALVILDVWLQGSRLDGLGILQNLHRYFFYLAVLVLAVLWWDALYALLPNFQWKGFTLLNLIMLANVMLLSGYTFGCHAYRHLVGGKLDCFSCPSAQPRYKMWQFVSKLNEHHMGWAWFSLFSVAFTDFAIRQVASGALPNIGFF